jgi:hypothetical protein
VSALCTVLTSAGRPSQRDAERRWLVTSVAVPVAHRADALWGATRNIAAASTTSQSTPRPGHRTDQVEEERLDAALKDMFEHDHTRMLLLYRLPPEQIVNDLRPDWGRLIRNKPEFPNSNQVAIKKKKKTASSSAAVGPLEAKAKAKAGKAVHKAIPLIPRGRFNADVDDYEDGPVSAAGAAQWAMKQQDEQWSSLKTSLSAQSTELAKSESEWGIVRQMPRPDSSMSELAAELGIDFATGMGAAQRARSLRSRGGRGRRSTTAPLGRSRSENNLPLPRRL